MKAVSSSPSSNYDIVAPEPAALIESLRSVGYTLPAAVADIIDNSIAAGAKNIHVTFHWSGEDSFVFILDDGRGMSEEELKNAMRPGSRNPLEERAPRDLGRFGLGLKTASLSQCRNLCVASKPNRDSLTTRTWDLDALAISPEWRLLYAPPPVAAAAIKKLSAMPKGTVVVWSELDRIVGDEQAGDAVANSRFNDSIDHVRDHLGLTFHRFLEDRTIKLFLNEKPISPWNPFLCDGRSPSSPTPEEFIPFGRSGVTLQGFILPHKDALTEEEFQKHGGPRGWAAQQGFYVYRNKRLLVYGDWLRLGRPSAWTREEHYRLARIRLDILNDADAEWHLDVKKSTARPPALIRDRLTDLAEHVRAKARSVFVHRGKYGKRTATVTPTERPWLSTVRENRRVYSINREHPAVQAVIRAFPDKATELAALLRLLEETVPVEQIWLDTAEQSRDHAAPYVGVEFSIIKADMRRVVEFLIKTGINRKTAIERLRSVEPFDRYPHFINEL
ncbi:MAG: ATP-binding protein [Kiritimatiellaeota bacterium]|nr:ATP-binding protein [Kiritimatiellota bacterium]